jgi:cell wall assembly regulator SMI1
MTEQPDELMQAIKATDGKNKLEKVKALATMDTIKIEHLRAAQQVYENARKNRGGLAGEYSAEKEIFDHLLSTAKPELRKQFEKELDAAQDAADQEKSGYLAKLQRRDSGPSSNGSPKR